MNKESTIIINQNGFPALIDLKMNFGIKIKGIEKLDGKGEHLTDSRHILFTVALPIIFK